MFQLLDNTKLKQKFEYLDSIFRYLYLVLVFLTFCGWTAGTPVVSKYALVVVFFAGLTLIYKAIFFKNFYFNKYHLLLALFVLSHIFSSLMNRSYGLGSNIKATIWLVLLFAGIGSFDIQTAYEKLQSKLDKILYVFLSLNFLMLLGSMYYLFTVKGDFFYIDRVAKKANLIGMLWGRLWGIFTDPNYGGVIQIIAIVLTLYYLGQTKSKLLKALHYIQLLMAGLYYSYSNSRTAFVSAVVVAFAYCFFTYYRQWMKAVKHFLICFCIIFTVGGIAPKVIHIYMNSGIYSTIAKIEKGHLEDKINEFESEKAKREQEIESDLSNRRFELWKSAIEIGKTSPIWGVSNRNVVPYAEVNLPETYMVNNSMESNFDSSHNLIFDIWMAQGIIGIAIFGLFGIFYVIDIYKIVHKEYLDKRLRIIFTCIIGLMASALFIPDLVYVNSIGSYILWNLMGFSIYYIQMKKNKK